MNTNVPPYLRVHHGEETPAARPAKQSSTDEFWTAFSAATGWRIDRRHDADDVKVLPAVEMDLMAGDPNECQPVVVREDAAELATRAKAMAAEIEELRSIVRRQELELAAHAAAPIAPSRSEKTSQRIHTTLGQAIAATGFDAAAIYLLDDETQHLHTRAVVGLPEDRLGAEPRMLRGSRADLEALVQEAVLIDDVHGMMGQTWNAPEDCRAAICTALYKGDLPIGTLWLFSHQPRSLGESDSAVARLASAQITLELTHAASERRERETRESRQAITDINAWQHSALPPGSELAQGWFADGMIESPHPWTIGWHLWDILPDGTLMLAIGQAEENHASGALIASTARAALIAHSGYRHSVRQMMQRIGDTLWQSSTSDQLMSVLYLHLDPESGEGTVASAGNIDAMIVGDHGYRPLISGGVRPLASSIDIDCIDSTFHLLPGECLIGYGAGLQLDGIGQGLIGCCLRKAMKEGHNPLPVLRREMAAFPTRHERGIVSVFRRQQ